MICYYSLEEAHRFRVSRRTLRQLYLTCADLVPWPTPMLPWCLWYLGLTSSSRKECAWGKRQKKWQRTSWQMCDGQVRSSGDEKTREKHLDLDFKLKEGGRPLQIRIWRSVRLDSSWQRALKTTPFGSRHVGWWGLEVQSDVSDATGSHPVLHSPYYRLSTFIRMVPFHAILSELEPCKGMKAVLLERGLWKMGLPWLLIYGVQDL